MFLMSKLKIYVIFCANLDGCKMLYFREVLSAFFKELFCQPYNGII